MLKPHTFLVFRYYFHLQHYLNSPSWHFRNLRRTFWTLITKYCFQNFTFRGLQTTFWAGAVNISDKEDFFHSFVIMALLQCIFYFVNIGTPSWCTMCDCSNWRTSKVSERLYQLDFRLIITLLVSHTKVNDEFRTFHSNIRTGVITSTDSIPIFALVWLLPQIPFQYSHWCDYFHRCHWSVCVKRLEWEGKVIKTPTTKWQAKLQWWKQVSVDLLD